MMILPGVLTVFVLLIALVHIYWGLGFVWPARDSRSLARTVVGARGIERMPSRRACFAVAVVLLVAAVWPLVLIGLVPFPAPDWLIFAVGAAMALACIVRGIASYVPLWRRLVPEEPFARLDRRYYGPISLALGAGYTALVVKGLL